MTSEQSGEEEKGTIKKKTFTFGWPLKLAVSVAVLALLFTQADSAAFWRMVTASDPAWLTLGVAMILLEPIILSATWSAVLRDKGFNTPFLPVLRISLVSDFLGFILPSSLGSDLVKGIGLSKYIANPAEAITSLFVLRATSYIVLFAIALLTIMLFGHQLPDHPLMDAIAWLLALGFVAGGVFLYYAKPALGFVKGLLFRFGQEALFGKLYKLYDAFLSYRHHPTTFLKAVAGGTLSQINRVLYMYVIALAMGISVDPAPFFVFIPIVTVVTMIPVSLAGIGVREGGYVFLFAYVGISVGEALGMSILGFALNLSAVLLGGAVYLAVGFPNPEGLEKLKKETEPEGEKQ